MKQLIKRTSEIILFAFLAIFPFSYGHLTIKWIILFIPLIIFLIILSQLLKKSRLNINNLSIIFVILLMIIFDFTEKVNFIQQLRIHVEISNRIPFTTILLAFAILVFMINVLKDGKVIISNQTFVRYLFYSCVFLVILMILFYPLLWHYYRMAIDLNIQLLNKIIKYLMIFLLASNYLSDEKKMKKMNFGFVLSIGITVILYIIF